jgi:hypothetical protein
MKTRTGRDKRRLGIHDSKIGAVVLALILGAGIAIPAVARPHPFGVGLAAASTFFTDDFSSGTFSAWSGSTNLTIDPTRGRTAPPSARARVTSSPAWAYRTLGTTLSTGCVSVGVNVTSLGSPFVTLLRLRTAANGKVARVFVNSTGVLWVKSDVSGLQVSSSTPIGTGWHQIELCGTVGAMGTWNLSRDGIRIVTNWSANTGITPIGRVEIGDDGAKTFTANFDDAMVTDTDPGAETDPPTTPGVPTGSSPTPGAVTIQWTASQDASPPITYRVYRDHVGAPIATTSTTSFTETGLVPGSSHVYAVDAVDSLNNPASPQSAWSGPIVVMASAPTLLVLHYTFDHDANGIVTDSSSRALHGRLVDADPATAYAVGVPGRGLALTLVGADHEWIDVPQSDALDANRFTIAALVRYTGVQNDKTLGRWEVLEKAGAYWLNIRTDGRVRVGGFFGSCGGGTAWKYLDSANPIPRNTWTHVAGTYTGSRLNVWVNGVLSSSRLISGTTCANNEPLAVGAKNAPAEGLLEAFWDGQLDDVRVYARALAASEIAGLVPSYIRRGYQRWAEVTASL